MLFGANGNGATEVSGDRFDDNRLLTASPDGSRTLAQYCRVGPESISGRFTPNCQRLTPDDKTRSSYPGPKAVP